MKRIYHPYTLWEEVGAGMWSECSDKNMLDRAIAFTGDAKLYGSYMARVVTEWRYSPENWLTAPINRLAWLGHAAAALAICCPEDITRKAWGFLTQDQRDLANLQAEKYVTQWERNHVSRLILEHGKRNVTEWEIFLTKHPENLSQAALFPLTA